MDLSQREAGIGNTVKTISTQLMTFLRSSATSEMYSVDLIDITLRSGLVLHVTTGQIDIFYAGRTYFASLNGTWDRGEITSEVGLTSSSMKLSLHTDGSIMVPGTSVGFLEAALKGFFDSADILVKELTMPINQYGSGSMGTVTQFWGDLGEITQVGKSSVEFDAHDKIYRLNDPLPKHLIQSSCGNTLYDSRCLVNKNNFAETALVASANGLVVNLATPLVNTVPRYSKGQAKMVGGQNVGLSKMIRVQVSTTQILLSTPFLFPIASGELITLYAGCDQTTGTCTNTFNNIIHFTGCPFVPAPETIV